MAARSTQELLAAAVCALARSPRRNEHLIAELLHASTAMVDQKVASRIVDEFAANACPWQDCQHRGCINTRAQAAAARAQLAIVQDPKLITLREANERVQNVWRDAREGQDVAAAAEQLIAHIDHDLAAGAIDSVALEQEISIARQAVAMRQRS